MLEKQAFILHKIFKIFKKTCFYAMLTFKQIFNTLVVSAKFLLHDMHEKGFFILYRVQGQKCTSRYLRYILHLM